MAMFGSTWDEDDTKENVNMHSHWNPDKEIENNTEGSLHFSKWKEDSTTAADEPIIKHFRD